MALCGKPAGTGLARAGLSFSLRPAVFPHCFFFQQYPPGQRFHRLFAALVPGAAAGLPPGRGFFAVAQGGADYRHAVGGAGLLCRFCAGALPALFRAHAVLRHGQRPAGDARSHHRAVLAAVDGGGATRRGLARARFHHHRDRPHAARHGLCHGGDPVAPERDGPIAGRSRHGPGLPAHAGVLSGDAAQYRARPGFSLAAHFHPVV